MTARDRFELKLAQLFSVFALFVGLTGGSLAVAQGPLPNLPNVSSSPVGAIVAFGGSTAPPGWLMTDGSTVSATQFPELCAVLGSSFGSAPAGQCKLPDLRGRVPVGVDGAAGRLSANDALGNSGGEEKHQLITAELPSHSHGDGLLAAAAHAHGAGGLSANAAGGHSHTISAGGGGQWTNFSGAAGAGAWTLTAPGDGWQMIADFAGVHGHAISGDTASAGADVTGSTASVGSDNAHNVMQPFQVVNYIIHAKPAP